MASDAAKLNDDASSSVAAPTSLSSDLNPQRDNEEPETKNFYSKNVNVFDVIMKDDDIDGEPIKSSWYWLRKEIEVPIRSLEAPEFKRITDNNTKKTRIGRSSQYNTELEVRGYNAEIVANACMNPNFQDPSIRKGLAKKFNMSEDSAQDIILVEKVWLIGEIASMALRILDLTGFNDDDEIVKALKDSSSGETT